jgi:hypothetical protein
MAVSASCHRFCGQQQIDGAKPSNVGCACFSVILRDHRGTALPVRGMAVGPRQRVVHGPVEGDEEQTHDGNVGAELGHRKHVRGDVARDGQAVVDHIADQAEQRAERTNDQQHFDHRLDHWRHLNERSQPRIDQRFSAKRQDQDRLRFCEARVPGCFCLRKSHFDLFVSPACGLELITPGLRQDQQLQAGPCPEC